MFKKLFLCFLIGASANGGISAQVKVAALDYKIRVLPNNLQIVSLADRTSPTVAVQVWYRVGSKDDPPGRSGFAHLFEHLMFKNSRNLKNEQFDRLTEDVGGSNNATTADDRTSFYEVVPSNHLESLLWAEAERMTNLNVDEQNFQSEREVVKEEYRQSVLAEPYGSFFEQIQTRSYAAHPYRRSTIGSIEDLNRASIEDARNFYQLYYRPDNAVLIVVGDFDQNQLDGWIDKYFKSIAPRKTRIPRVKTIEPPRRAEQRIVATAPNVPLPAVAVTYLAPPSANQDIIALQIAEAILSDGDSSRIYQQLIYKQQIAQQAGFFVEERIDNGLLVFYAIAARGKQLSQIEKSLLAELKRMQTVLVSDAELEKAKNKLVTAAVVARETNSGKAEAIGNAMIYRNDLAAVNDHIEKLQKITAPDVRRVMQNYFADNNRVVIYYQNEIVGGEPR